MPVRIITGINWGDEGKGRSVDDFVKLEMVVGFALLSMRIH